MARARRQGIRRPGAWRVVVESPEGFANALGGVVRVIDPSIPEEKGADGELVDSGQGAGPATVPPSNLDEFNMPSAC